MIITFCGHGRISISPEEFAILKRNEWMIDNSDMVIAYVKYPWGGARKTLDYAVRKKKQFINFSKK